MTQAAPPTSVVLVVQVLELSTAKSPVVVIEVIPPVVADALKSSTGIGVLVVSMV